MERLAMALRSAALHASRRHEEDKIATIIMIEPVGITIACTKKINNNIYHEKGTLIWEAFFFMDHEQRIIEAIDALHYRLNQPGKIAA